MKPIQFNAFAGLRNDISPERFSKEDLLTATNIELDETGKPYRRLGTTLLDATATHSLWAEDEFCFCVRGGVLTRILSDMTFQSLGVAITGQRVRYSKVLGDVYWTDGVQSGILSNAGNRLWGIPVPSFAMTATSGVLVPGTYLATVTHVRSNGLESGAAPVQSINVPSAGGISFTLPNSTDPLVVEKRIYLSDVNGELAYLCATLTGSDTTATITQLPVGRTLAVRTLRMGPPPVGSVVVSYKGRIYVAENNYLWYTQPYEYELVHRAMNFIGFNSPIKTLAVGSDGLFVGSDTSTVYLAGDEPNKFEMQPLADYGTVYGTEVNVPKVLFKAPEGASANSDVPMWMSKNGLCVGLDDGSMLNLTGGRYTLPEGVATGASLLKLRGASPQLVTTLFS